MNKIQKLLEFIKSDIGFYSSVLIIIVFLFCILNPKISNQIFSFKRNSTLNNFINITKSKGAIDSQEYWEFREFYSPGYFVFSNSVINKTLLDKAKAIIGLKYNEKNVSLVFLIFSSPNLNSIDMLTKQTDLTKMFNKPQNINVIFINKNCLIYKADSTTIKIVFLLSNADMRRANGFFDYQDKDKKITEGENWFNITSLKIN